MVERERRHLKAKALQSGLPRRSGTRSKQADGHERPSRRRLKIQ
jgi:hypothetical protein